MSYSFKEYQEKTLETAVYPDRGNNYLFPLIGLGGESGEVFEKVKKLIRDKDGKIDEEFKEGIKKELGDLLWYLTQISTEFGLSLEDIALGNIEKITSRYKRGVVKGDGDNR